MSGIDEIEDVYEFDVSKETWSKLKQTGDVPKPRDDHSLAQIDDERFIIFGGFVDGSRTNECFVCTKQNNTLQW
jgi:N-acetylneuraminic acid mutarotase